MYEVNVCACVVSVQDSQPKGKGEGESGTVAYIVICSPRNFGVMIDCYVIALWHFTGG